MVSEDHCDTFLQLQVNIWQNLKFERFWKKKEREKKKNKAWKLQELKKNCFLLSYTAKSSIRLYHPHQICS